MPTDQEPLVLLNGVPLNDDVRTQLDWDKSSNLTAAATHRPAGSIRTFRKNIRRLPQIDAFNDRSLVLHGQFIRCPDFLGKAQIRAIKGALWNTRRQKLQVGTLVSEPSLSVSEEPDDEYKHLPDIGSFRLQGDADGTWKRLYSECAGDPQPGGVPGFPIRDDRPDNANLKGTGNPITLTNPGSAATNLVARVSNASYASTSVYIRTTHKDALNTIVITLDAYGVGEIVDGDGLCLPPGAQSIRFEDAAGALLATGTWAMAWCETEWQFIGNSGNHMAECSAVFEVARLGNATYVNSDEDLVTAVDGEPRIGMPWQEYDADKAGAIYEVGSTNLVLLNEDLSNAATWPDTTGTVARVAAADPRGGTTAWTLTDNDAAAAEAMQQTITVSTSTSMYTDSWFIKKDAVSTRVAGFYFVWNGGTSHDCFVQVRTDTGATQVTQGSGTVRCDSALDGTWWRLQVTKAGQSNTSHIQRVYPAHAATLGGATDVTLTGSVTVWRPQFENLAFASSSIGTTAATATRNADSCATVLQHNLLDNADDFSVSTWLTAVWTGVTRTPNNVAARNGTLNASTVAATGGGAGRMYRQYAVSGATAGRKFVFDIDLKAGSGSVTLQLVEGGGAAGPADMNTTGSYTLSSGFLRYRVSGTMVQNDRTYIELRINGTAPITLVLWRAKLVEGAFSGLPVGGVDAILPEDADRTVPTGWDQNGWIEWYSVNPGDLGVLGVSGAWHFIGNGDPVSSAAGDIRVYRYPWNSGTAYVKIKRATNLGTYAPDVPGVSSLYDFARHRLRLEWQRYWLWNPATGLMQLYMWLYFWVDGVLKHSVDVAATTGATSWSTLDRFWLADGRTQAIITPGPDGLIGFPKLPAGAIVDAV